MGKTWNAKPEDPRQETQGCEKDATCATTVDPGRPKDGEWLAGTADLRYFRLNVAVRRAAADNAGRRRRLAGRRIAPRAQAMIVGAAFSRTCSNSPMPTVHLDRENPDLAGFVSGNWLRDRLEACRRNG